MLSRNYMELFAEGADNDWKDAKRMDAYVQAGCLGEVGANHSTGGVRSKLSAANQVENGYIRIGSINCSAFRELQRCEFG
jgi:glutamate 5-kinase